MECAKIRHISKTAGIAGGVDAIVRPYRDRPGLRILSFSGGNVKSAQPLQLAESFEISSFHKAHHGHCSRPEGRYLAVRKGVRT
jgi:hypothetical protein